MEHVLELNRSSTAALSQRHQFSQDKEDKWLTVTDCVATALEWTLLISWCPRMSTIASLFE